MTRLVLVAAVAGAAVLTACGGGAGSDADSAASSTVSARSATSAGSAGEVRPAPSADASASAIVVPEGETAVPEAPPAPAGPPADAPAGPEPTVTPVAEPCAEVNREYLITTLRMTGGPQFPLADLEQVRCSANFATAMSVPDGASQPSMYLFQYGEQAGHTHWRVIDVGSALDCVNRHGVPADVARRIQCGA